MKAPLALLLAAFWLPPPALAQARTPERPPSLMARCEAQADAGRMLGYERRRHLAACFAGKRKPESLQVQFSGCEAQARRKGLRGGDLRSFMGQCMRA